MSKIREWLGLGYYTSELDGFLGKLASPLSDSQQKEAEKYADIFDRRDHPRLPNHTKTAFWNNF